MYTCYGKSMIGDGTIIGDHVIIGYPSRSEIAECKSLSTAELKDIDGAKIGANCTIRDFGIIYSKSSLGDRVQTGHHYLVREETTIGEDTLIGSNVIIENKCVIGKNVSIQSGVYIPTFCKIGNEVFLGPNAVLTNDKYIGYNDPRNRGLEGVTIKDQASIGANSTILPGVTIGSNAVIGSGSVVTRDVLADEVVLGVPARKLEEK